MPSSLLIERFGRHVNAVWPCNRGCFWIDTGLRKVARVPKRFENTGPVLRREVDVPDSAIIEKQAESVLPEDSHADNCWKVRQFVSMETRPFANETQSSWLKAPGQDDAINRNGGLWPA